MTGKLPGERRRLIVVVAGLIGWFAAVIVVGRRAYDALRSRRRIAPRAAR